MVMKLSKLQRWKQDCKIYFGKPNDRAQSFVSRSNNMHELHTRNCRFFSAKRSEKFQLKMFDFVAK